jgi:hypothetical protein
MKTCAGEWGGSSLGFAGHDLALCSCATEIGWLWPGDWWGTCSQALVLAAWSCLLLAHQPASQLRAHTQRVIAGRAQAMIESDPRVLDRLGGQARCLSPVSQSSMAQSINGRVSRVVTLALPVVGAGGRAAQAQVQWVEGAGAGGDEQLTVSVRLPSGEVVRLDRGGGGGSGGRSGTIDVEWREV